MKSKAVKFHFFLPAIMALLLSGCAFHEGAFNSGVAITNNQFRVVGIAEGQSSTTHIFGLGGLSKDALVQEAKRDLYSKYPLTKGMVLANVTVDFKRSYFFIAASTLVTVSGDVIDFNPANLNLPYKGFYTDDSTFFPMEPFPISTQAKKFVKDIEVNYIKEGSKVVFKINNVEMKGMVEEINNFGIKCRYETETGMKKIYLKGENLTVTQF
jgi:hypothetical protein